MITVQNDGALREFKQEHIDCPPPLSQEKRAELEKELGADHERVRNSVYRFLFLMGQARWKLILTYKEDHEIANAHTAITNNLRFGRQQNMAPVLRLWFLEKATKNIPAFRASVRRYFSGNELEDLLDIADEYTAVISEHRRHLKS